MTQADARAAGSATRAAAEGSAVVVLCAVPEDFDAGTLAVRLVEDGLAACVQIGPSVRSVYRWRGAIEQASERLLVIKSRAARFEELEAAIRAAHPYEVPEIVALPVTAGSAPYLSWLDASTS